MGSWDALLLECLLASVAVVSFSCNSLVLLCFSRSSEICARALGLFILNLPVCNILSSVLNVPTTLLALSRNQKPFRDSLCRVASFADTFLTTNSMLSMAALGVDRWAAVGFPLTYSSRVRHKHAGLTVAHAWVHSLALSTVPALFSWTDYSPVCASCTVHVQPMERGFAFFTMVFHCASFAFTLLVLCLTYLKVLKVARFHSRRYGPETSGAGGHSSECETKMINGAEKKKTEGYHESLHIYRLFCVLLHTVCHNKTGRTDSLSADQLALADHQ